MKKISQNEFDLLKLTGDVCPYTRNTNLSFTVGREYIIRNPSDKNEKIKVTCTQDCPYNLRSI